MTRDAIIKRLTDIGFTEGCPGLRGRDGSREQTFRHRSLEGELASLHVSEDRLTANGLYEDQLEAVASTGHNSKGKPFWEGEALEEALRCLERRYSTKRVSDVLRAFDALTPNEQRQAAVEILRRWEGAGDLPPAAYDELASELFRAYDVEEAANANPGQG